MRKTKPQTRPTTLKLSPELELPTNAVTQKLAFLGTSGSGKTYGAGKFAELLLEIGAQVIVIDTIGNWWGLRVGADGKAPGFQIPILGGDRGDVPLDETAGKLVAELATTTRSSMIVDVSDFTESEMRTFVIDFAKEFLRLKKQHRGPVMVIWEECQDIIPQFVTGEDARMVGAVKRLIKKGRNHGVGTTLISQRSAAVNKECLNQAETVFAFRTSGPQDRDAIKKWCAEKAEGAIDMVAELPKLPTGNPFCWSPSWLGVLKTFKISAKRTFDASSTPDFDDAEDAAPLVPIDLGAFKARMEESAVRVKTSDPTVLKKKIAELTSQVKILQENLQASVTPEIATSTAQRDREDARKSRDKAIAERDRARAELDQVRAAMANLQGKLREHKKSLRFAFEDAKTVRSRASDIVTRSASIIEYIDLEHMDLDDRLAHEHAFAVAAGEIPKPPRFPTSQLTLDDDGKRGSRKPAPHDTQQGADTPGHGKAAGNVADPHRPPIGHRGTELSSSSFRGAHQTLLNTMLLMKGLGFAATRENLAAWLGTHVRNRNLGNYLSALRTAGLVEGFELTAAGEAAAVPVKTPTREQLLAKISPARRRIVEILIDHADGLDRDQLANELGTHVRNRNLGNYLSYLRSRQLITKDWPVRLGPVMEVLQ